MKILARLITFFAVFIGFAQPLLAQRDRIGIMPPIEPPFPPRIEIIFPNNVRPPDIGPMEIREMGVSAKINGLYAEVETTLSFHNPNGRQLEGDLIFPLPDGAAVSGYALDIQGTMVDGVIVPKEKARVAFETEVRRKVDPGLVEHVKGNLYRTRIFPLPANGERRIRLKYITPLTTAQNGDAALLLGMPRESIAKLDVEIEVSTHADVRPEIGGLGDKRFEQAENVWRVKSSSKDTKPGEDIIVALPKLPNSLHQIQRDAEGKNWFMISTVPEMPKKSDSPGIELLHILWDASGSRAGANLSKEFELLSKIPANAFRLTVFLACGLQSGFAAEETPRPREVIGTDLGGKAMTVYLARDRAAWDEVKKSAGARQMLPIGMKGQALEVLDSVNFQKEMIVAVFWGEKNFSGQGETCRIQEVLTGKEEVTVKCHALLWGGAVKHSYRAWPFHVKVVNRSNLPVTFISTTEDKANPKRAIEKGIGVTLKPGEWKAEIPVRN